MHTHPLFPSSRSDSIFTLFIFITIFATYTHQQSDQSQYYNNNCSTQPYNCGQNIRNITYPFWGDGRPKHCGHPAFELKCLNGEYPTIDIDNRTLRVLEINQSSRLMTIARLDIWHNFCVQELSNFTLKSDLFVYTQEVRSLNLFYGCNSSITRELPMNNFTCPIDGSDDGGYFTDEGFLRVQPHIRSNISSISCNFSVEIPVLRTALDKLSNKSLTLQQALNQGFEVLYINDQDVACSSGGQACQNGGNDLNVPRKVAIGLGAAGITLIVMVVIFFVYLRRHNKRYISPSWTSRNTSFPSSMTGLEKAGTFNGVQIFSYNELGKATHYFDPKKELGDGGYGTVYQGKLKDGRVVAVKRLFEHNYKRVEQFLNEVEILTRLRHQNLVSLYGCTSRQCRELLLVYEYIPNGTVADHLHGERARPGSLSWSTRMSIALETASALAYLHASDVIHRDVKTNNLLLDNNFCVKVADFGLSRLFPTDATHVSTAPQGTPGYVDPEYHECYQLTNKSDVYSFGVVLIELISSKPAVDITRHRHEINLSNMAISKIQNRALHELVDPYIGFESDYKVREMVADVAELAFQCLQNESELRPSMEEVLEVLKRIQSGDCDMKNAEEVDIPANELCR